MIFGKINEIKQVFEMLQLKIRSCYIIMNFKYKDSMLFHIHLKYFSNNIKIFKCQPQNYKVKKYQEDVIF